MEQLSLTNLPPQSQDPSLLAPNEPDSSNTNSSDSEIFLDDKNETNPEGSGVTKTIEKYKKKYSNITNDQRTKLLDAVENKGEKIKHAAKRLSINYSSAKSIYQVFKREGRSNKKAFKRRGLREDELNALSIKQNFIENPKDQQINSLPTQTTNTMTENQQTDPQDPLIALRDRLLNSRAKKDPEDSGTTAAGNNNSFQDSFNAAAEQQQQQQNGFQVWNPTQKITPEFNEKVQVQQQQQPQVYYMVQYPSAPMMFPQQSMMPGNFAFNMGGFPQNLQLLPPPPSSGPTQTININQPQAKNLNIQSITFPSDNNNPQGGGNLNTFQMQQSFPQMQNQQQQGQVQYVQIQPQNQQVPMMVQPNNGYQYQYMQPQVVYMMPQQGNSFGQQIMPQFNTVNYNPAAGGMNGNLMMKQQQQQQQPWMAQMQVGQNDMKQKMMTAETAFSDKKEEINQ